MGKQDKMDRRQFLFGAAAAAPLLGARSAIGAEPGPRDAELRALLDTFWPDEEGDTAALARWLRRRGLRAFNARDARRSGDGPADGWRRRER